MPLTPRSFLFTLITFLGNCLLECIAFNRKTRESFARQMDSNLTSVITMLHHAIPHLRRSPTGCGKAVFVSSGAATGQTAAWGAYNASKAALNAIARTLANEEPSLAVWAVRPGVVDTEVRAMARAGLCDM